MTAIGFVLAVVGWLWMNAVATPFSFLSKQEYAAAACFLIGLALLVSGVAKFLWAVMP